MRFIIATLSILAAASAVLAQTPSTDPLVVRPRAKRQAVTPELERTAFVDARARTLLTRARTARIAQDSTLQSYDARTVQRATVGLQVKKLGLGRTMMRAENAAHVRWSRNSGLWIEPTGRRAVAPMVKEATVNMDLAAATPIPYFPGRESLWLPSSYARVAQVEVNEEDLLHPLATGAEAYYRYSTGDSISIRLPDGQVIALRELRITSRRPDWRAFVGSFWFDVDRGYLVRAVYRLATDIDFWKMMDEDARRDIEQLEEIARTDTGVVARRAREALSTGAVQGASRLAKAIITNLRATISSVTVEYGLHENRFWLPRLHVAEGEVTTAFVRMPIRIEESFRYESVNGDLGLPPIPTLADLGLPASDTTTSASLTIGSDLPAYRTLADSLRVSARQRGDTSVAGLRAREDSIAAFIRARAVSLRQRADSAQAAGDTILAKKIRKTADAREVEAAQVVRRSVECGRDSSYTTTVRSRFGGALRVAMQMPCDTMRLAKSPDLPPSIYDPAEDLFGSAEDRDEFLKSLDLMLQSGWGPQRPTFHTGLDLVRYNRIEGLSLGASATSALGFGYSARAVARFGLADRVPNGEVTLSRSNGRSEINLTGFHRLAVANDDRGSPLSFGASLSNLLFGRDEGFYYRSVGAEVSGTRDAPGPLGGSVLAWRAFLEGQRSADIAPNVQFSLANALGDRTFDTNIDATRRVALGAAGDLERSFGADPVGFRMNARVRGEAAIVRRNGTADRGTYERLTLDATAARGLGTVAAAITGVVGVGNGELGPQRAFYVGGLNTVRGQSARAFEPGHVGNAMWLGRGELGLATVWARPSLFYDVGWAGDRDDFGQPGRPLSGAGVGLSFLDGLLRTDVSRGIWPEKSWRLDLYLDALF